MIEFECQCRRTFRIPDEYARKKAKCPVCERVFTIPEKASTPEGLIDSHGTGQNAPHERKRTGLRFPRFLALAGVLAALLVAVIMITVIRQKGFFTVLRENDTRISSLEKSSPKVFLQNQLRRSAI